MTSTDDGRTLVPETRLLFTPPKVVFTFLMIQCQGHRLLARILILVFRKCGLLGADLSEDPGMIVPTEPKEDVICLLSLSQR